MIVLGVLVVLIIYIYITFLFGKYTSITITDLECSVFTVTPGSNERERISHMISPIGLFHGSHLNVTVT